jgi:hypothetical protein
MHQRVERLRPLACNAGRCTEARGAAGQPASRFVYTAKPSGFQRRTARINSGHSYFWRSTALSVRYAQSVMTKQVSPEEGWASEWLDAVAAGESTMSQRKLTTVEKRGGGLATIRAAAKRRGVHLLLLTDDKGNELVAASTLPFKVVC